MVVTFTNADDSDKDILAALYNHFHVCAITFMFVQSLSIIASLSLESLSLSYNHCQCNNLATGFAYVGSHLFLLQLVEAILGARVLHRNEKQRKRIIIFL